MCDTYFFTLTISIHALREESDFNFGGFIIMEIKFQSTLSVRRATKKSCTHTDICPISIHALREESDQTANIEFLSHIAISIHALREESDRARERETL